MLDLQVDIEGEKVIIEGLKHLDTHIPEAVQKGLTIVARGVHRRAYNFLSGPGLEKSDISTGSYPVPVRTGHLRRHLDFLSPGQSKTAGDETFQAGALKVIVYDSAEYSRVIHEGLGSSEKFGKRPYLTDALLEFNQGNRILKIIEKEIGQVIKDSGFF